MFRRYVRGNVEHRVWLAWLAAECYRAGNRNIKSPIDNLPCHAGIAREAMKDSLRRREAIILVSQLASPCSIILEFLFDNSKGISFRFPAVNNNGQVPSLRDIDLACKYLLLFLRRRKIVVII